MNEVKVLALVGRFRKKPEPWLAKRKRFKIKSVNSSLVLLMYKRLVEAPYQDNSVKNVTFILLASNVSR